MNLVSDFKDYYDSLLYRYPNESSFVWKRYRETIKGPEALKIYRHLNYAFPSRGLLFVNCGYSIQPYLLCFTDRVIPGYKLSINNNLFHIYSCKELDKLIELDYPIKLYYYLQEFLTNEYLVNSIAPWQELQTPVFTISLSVYSSFNNLIFIITKNPKLDEYHLFKILNPYDTYQLITTGLNKLTQVNEDHLEIPNQFKILAHGFDVKKSFRTRKKVS